MKLHELVDVLYALEIVKIVRNEVEIYKGDFRDVPLKFANLPVFMIYSENGFIVIDVDHK